MSASITSVAHACRLAVCVCLLANWIMSGGARAETPEEFYRKTTFTVAIGSGVGGSNDANARTIARHIGKHIPGNPTVTVRNVPGAGSRVLANQMVNTLPRDGSLIGALNRATVFEDLYAGRSGELIFNPLELNWIGAPDRITAVAVSWHTSPIKTADDLLKHELVVGSSGGTTTTVPKIMQEVAGFKFKIIVGYTSGRDVDLAIERGEVQGRAATAWGGLKGRNAVWLKDKKVNLLYQTGLTKHPELPDVPLALDYAKTADDRKLLELFFAAEDIGYPYAAPPQVPADRLEALRKAFIATCKDPSFIADMKKQSLDVNPVSWEAMTRIINESYAAPQSVKMRLQSSLKG